MKRRTAATIILVSAILGTALVIAGVRILSKGQQSARYITRPAAFTDISATVTETGTLNPVDEVNVGTEISGTINSIFVDYNSIVASGQILATLDPSTFQDSLDQAAATLRLDTANVRSATLNVQKAKAQFDLAELTEQRDQQLLEKDFLAQSQMDTDKTNTLVAEEDYQSSLAAVDVAKAQLSVAQSQVEATNYNLSRTTIRSPISGVVLARNVSVGQTVAASLQTPTLFVIASNLTQMQVDTSVSEADVGAVRAGESASLSVTAFPNLLLPGTVEQLRANPTVTQNVVTYDAVVRVTDPKSRLLPGMTAQVVIDVDSKSHVLSLPIAALLFRPAAGRGAGRAPAGTSANSAVAGAPGSRVTVWSLRNNRPVPVQLVIGISDGRNVEVTSGNLKAGEPVIVAELAGSARRAAGQRSGASPGRGGFGGSGGTRGQVP